MWRKKILKRLTYSFVLLCILLNVVAFFHAYKFTHFDASKTGTKDIGQLSIGQKIRIAVLGVNNPRPILRKLPDTTFETIKLRTTKKLECWLIKSESSKGAVILFHGYGGEKSSMLDKAGIFLELGYSTMLVDFRGSGGSEGVQTTIGYDEAKDVKACYDYLTEAGNQSIHLFGTSMGAVAIMKAIADYGVNPSSIIIECPFGTMYKTVEARFKIQGVPAFPMAGLLMFWGGVQNGFWAFSHNPEEYAKSIACPTLLLYGGQDPKVSKEETESIYHNLQGEKKLIVYPLSGHENYLSKYTSEWTRDVGNFLSNKID